MIHRLWPLLALLLAIGACSPRQPSISFRTGELLADVNFDSTDDWEAYADPALGVSGRVLVNEGAYQLTIDDGGFIWALNGGSLVNTPDVIVEAQTEQLSEYEDNAYGLMCRADPSASGDGYYFFISGNGYYSIRRGAGREVVDLIPFTFSDAIRQGRDFNRIRIVCLGSYLALFVNGILVAETTDTLYASGMIGLTAAVPDGGDVQVNVEDVLVFTALPG